MDAWDPALAAPLVPAARHHRHRGRSVLPVVDHGRGRGERRRPVLVHELHGGRRERAAEPRGARRAGRHPGVPRLRVERASGDHHLRADRPARQARRHRRPAGAWQRDPAARRRRSGARHRRRRRDRQPRTRPVRRLHRPAASTPTRSCRAAGSAPATSVASTPTVSSRSPTARRTSSSAAARTSRRRRSRTCSRSTPRSPRRRWSGSPTPGTASGSPRSCMLRPGRSLDLDEVRRHFAELGVAKQKTPERLVEVDELPRTPSGKVRKVDLRQQLRERMTTLLVDRRRRRPHADVQPPRTAQRVHRRGVRHARRRARQPPTRTTACTRSCSPAPAARSRAASTSTRCGRATARCSAHEFRRLLDALIELRDAARRRGARAAPSGSGRRCCSTATSWSSPTTPASGSRSPSSAPLPRPAARCCSPAAIGAQRAAEILLTSQVGQRRRGGQRSAWPPSPSRPTRCWHEPRDRDHDHRAAPAAPWSRAKRLLKAERRRHPRRDRPRDRPTRLAPSAASDVASTMTRWQTDVMSLRMRSGVGF